MTTIAVSSTHVAWDSQVTYDTNVRIRSRSQKCRVFKHRLIAMSGDLIDERRVNSWIERGMPPKDRPTGSWDLLIIDAGGVKHMSNSEDSPAPMMVPFALGSGFRFALAVLMVTDDAMLAVKTAGRLDIGTSGPYHSIAYLPLIEKFKAARIEARKKAKAKKRVD